MAGLNRVVLIGRLVKDPELKKTPTGSSVTAFTLALDNIPKAGGAKTTSFIPCNCWNKIAENVAKYTSKGSLVAVEGKLNQRSYENKQGIKVSVIEVYCDSVQFLDKRQGSDSSIDSDSDYQTDPDLIDDSDNQSEVHQGIDSSDDDLPF